jgi:hypothetical protein
MSEHEEARERELLRRVLQYDIQDAVARYEAETRQRVAETAEAHPPYGYRRVTVLL